MLIPVDWSASYTVGCIAAYQFLKSLWNMLASGDDLMELDFSVAGDPMSHQEYLLDAICTELFGRIRNFLELPDSSTFPPVSFAMGLLTDWLETPSQSESNHIVYRFTPHWKLLGTFLTVTLKVIIIQQNGIPTDAQQVLVYELLRLWKCALKSFTRKPGINSSCSDSSAFLVLSEALHTCLVTYPNEAAELNRANDSNPTPPSFHPITVHLLLRSLRSLIKMVTDSTNSEWMCADLGSTVDSIIVGLICGLRTSPTGELQPGPILSSLSKMESERSLENKLQVDLLTPDPALCLRLIMLCGLELCVRLDPSNETVYDLTQTIYTTVLATRNPNEELVTYEEVLVQLLSGDDSHLFRCLNLWLELEDRLHKLTYAPHNLHKVIPNAHWTFARLAQTIDYSAHLLVDWIVSPETNCLVYLVRYLHRFRDPGRYSLIISTNAEASGNPKSDPGALENTLRSTGTTSHWPHMEVKRMLQSVARCLCTLDCNGNIPFSPIPLIRSINHAVSVM